MNETKSDEGPKNNSRRLRGQIEYETIKDTNYKEDLPMRNKN